MDHETDFLTQEFLYISLIEQKNIVIYPYLLPSKLDLLTKILGIFYAIQPFDVNNLSDSASLTTFFTMNNDQNNGTAPGGEKQTLILFTTGAKDLLIHAPIYPNLRFITLEKTLTLDQQQSSDFIVYNKKRAQFDNHHFDPISHSQAEIDAWHWCEFLQTELQSDPTIESIIPKLEKFWQNAQLYATAVMQGKNPSIDSMVTNSPEFMAMKRFCSAYYRLNILPDTLNISEELSTPLNLNDLAYTELTSLDRDHPEFAQVFMGALKSVPNPTPEPIMDPISKYIALRKSTWESEISFDYLFYALGVYVIELIKTQQITETGLLPFVQKVYQIKTRLFSNPFKVFVLMVF